MSTRAFSSSPFCLDVAPVSFSFPADLLCLSSPLVLLFFLFRSFCLLVFPSVVLVVIVFLFSCLPSFFLCGPRVLFCVRSFLRSPYEAEGREKGGGVYLLPLLSVFLFLCSPIIDLQIPPPIRGTVLFLPSPGDAISSPTICSLSRTSHKVPSLLFSSLLFILFHLSPSPYLFSPYILSTLVIAFSLFILSSCLLSLTPLYLQVCFFLVYSNRCIIIPCTSRYVSFPFVFPFRTYRSFVTILWVPHSCAPIFVPPKFLGLIFPLVLHASCCGSHPPQLL